MADATHARTYTEEVRDHLAVLANATLPLSHPQRFVWVAKSLTPVFFAEQEAWLSSAPCEDVALHARARAGLAALRTVRAEWEAMTHG